MHPAREFSPFEIEIFGSTDPGLQRENNEDNFVVSNLTTGEASSVPGLQKCRPGARGALLLVSDGMGGEQAGEVASRMCIELVPRRLRELLPGAEAIDFPQIALALGQAVEHANAAIYQKARCSSAERGMGCTLTASVVIERQVLTAQVGDSRAYLIRGGEIKQLTKDQTLGSYLASLHPEASSDIAPYSHNILTQAVGTAPTVKVRMTQAEVCHNDCLLVCSDGLYNMVANDEILRIVTATSGLAHATRELIHRANGRGGPDNITVILARFHASGEEPPASLPPITCLELDAGE